MFKSITKNVILTMLVMVLGILCMPELIVKAESFSGEGVQLKPSEEPSDAPFINFDTQYYIAANEEGSYDFNTGYVMVNVQKDGYIRWMNNDCRVTALYDSARNEVCNESDNSSYYTKGDNDYRYFDKKVEAGASYYLSLMYPRLRGGQIIFSFLEDKTGNTKADSEQIEPNVMYKETVAVEEDTDCYKITADVTGDALLAYTKGVGVQISYLNSGIAVPSKGYDYDTDTYNFEYLEVKKGDSYILNVSANNGYELEYNFIFLTAQVDSIEFDPEDISLGIQEKYQLKPLIMPELVVDGRVEYESSNPKVATVDSDGQIFTKSAGEATIFCKAVGSGVEGVFNLTVLNPIEDETAVINALTNMGNGMVRVNLKKCRYATGYEVEYAATKSMKNAKSVSFSSTGKNIKKLGKGKKYYFKARAFAIDGNGKRIYSKYSPVKAIRVSKR